MEVNKGDKVFYFAIKLNEDGTIEKIKEEYEVLASKENNLYKELIVLDDDRFTILQTKEDRYRMNELYGKPCCREMKWSISTMIDYIEGSLYTNDSNEKAAYRNIKKIMNKFINEKYGKYGNYINLLEKIEV